MTLPIISDVSSEIPVVTDREGEEGGETVFGFMIDDGSRRGTRNKRQTCDQWKSKAHAPRSCLLSSSFPSAYA